MQALAQELGGRVESSHFREFGHANLVIENDESLLAGLPDTRSLSVWMSHGDRVTELPLDLLRLGPVRMRQLQRWQMKNAVFMVCSSILKSRILRADRRCSRNSLTRFVDAGESGRRKILSTMRLRRSVTKSVMDRYFLDYLAVSIHRLLLQLL